MKCNNHGPLVQHKTESCDYCDAFACKGLNRGGGKSNCVSFNPALPIDSKVRAYVRYVEYGRKYIAQNPTIKSLKGIKYFELKGTPVSKPPQTKELPPDKQAAFEEKLFGWLDKQYGTESKRVVDESMTWKKQQAQIDAYDKYHSRSDTWQDKLRREAALAETNNLENSHEIMNDGLDVM